jgi:hypothetical protein
MHGRNSSKFSVTIWRHYLATTFTELDSPRRFFLHGYLESRLQTTRPSTRSKWQSVSRTEIENFTVLFGSWPPRSPNFIAPGFSPCRVTWSLDCKPLAPVQAASDSPSYGVGWNNKRCFPAASFGDLRQGNTSRGMGAFWDKNSGRSAVWIQNNSHYTSWDPRYPQHCFLTIQVFIDITPCRLVWLVCGRFERPPSKRREKQKI